MEAETNNRADHQTTRNADKPSSTTPRVDIVTVWYNRAYRVKESIGSIISQDLKGYRVFAVDDGSTDTTLAELEAMVEPARARGVELVVWTKANEGFTRSLKRCIEEQTTAPYIGLHGAGDISLPRRLSTLLELLRRNQDAVAAGCGVRVTDTAGTTLSSRTFSGITERNLAAGELPRPATHECAVIRRSAYDAIGGYREFFRYAQDSDLWVRLSRLGPVVNTPEILFEKVAIAESVSANWRKSLLQRKYSTLALQAGLAVDRGEPDPIPRLAGGIPTGDGSGEDGATPPGRPSPGRPARRRTPPPANWERAVDPRLLLPRYRFGKRIGKAIRDRRLADAWGLTGELVRAYVGAVWWTLRGY